MVKTMDTSAQPIDYDLMKSYELRTGFAGLGEFMEERGLVRLVRGESCYE